MSFLILINKQWLVDNFLFKLQIYIFTIEVIIILSISIVAQQSPYSTQDQKFHMMCEIITKRDKNKSLSHEVAIIN